MTYPKFLILATVVVFTAIAGVAAMKKHSTAPSSPSTVSNPPTELQLSSVEAVELDPEWRPHVKERSMVKGASIGNQPKRALPLESVDRIAEFFNTSGPTLAIVETVTYRSRVPWHKGRPAWLSDYASHYNTSRHFIARSLNGGPDYFKQDIAEGDRFNVLSPDKNVEFHLLIDLSRCAMHFFYTDVDSGEKVLIKSYQVGIGRPDSSKPSGLLTPIGKYQLGSKIAIYHPKSLGVYNGQKIEMVRIFGSRWIPFEKEISGCSAPAKGFGLHGVPWELSPDGEWRENGDSLGKYESDGCIRLATRDIEEIYAIVITKPTFIEIVETLESDDIVETDKNP